MNFKHKRAPSGKVIPSITPSDYAWIKKHKLNLEEELYKTNCKNTGTKWNGVLGEVTIACIDEPTPHIIWWMRGSRIYKQKTKPLK